MRIAGHAVTTGRVTPLREDFMDRIFSVLSAAFGEQFAAKWDNTTPDEMKVVWGRKLAAYSDQPDAIRGALDEAIERQYPPNLGEFYLMCQRRYKAPPVVRAEPVLEDKRTPEQKELATIAAKRFVADFIKRSKAA